MSNKPEKKGGLLTRCLNGIERVGNALPHPVTLFAIMALAVVVISAICAAMGVSATGNLVSGGELKETTVTAVSLLTKEGLKYIFTGAVNNFTTYAPLGMVLVAMLGVGVAEKSGMIDTLLKNVVKSTPKKLLTPMIVFLGVMSNIASDAGYVILIPLGAMMFHACGRHPIAGLAAAFAGVSGGWSANLLIGTGDPMFAGITTAAAQMLNPSYSVTPLCNWYFMFASTFVITLVGTFVTDKIVEPRLGKYEGEIDTTAAQALTDAEKKGMRYAGIAALVYVALILVCLLPTNGLLRSATGGVLSSPFMSGIIFFMMLLFLIPGIAFGIGAGTIKSDKDIVDMMTKGIQGLGGFMVLIFFAAQFTSLFTMSNLGTILSFKGADFLRAIGFTGLPLIIAMIILTALVNLLVAVDSAKWVMMAPIFVPMFMNLGFAPELTQVAYRIGDSCTNIIAPTMPFFVLTVSLFQKYDKKAGIGSVVATMLPYTIGFLIGWTILFSIFYLLNLPLGPGATIFYAG